MNLVNLGGKKVLLHNTIDKLIETALSEDITYLDIATDFTFDDGNRSTAQIIAKSDGVVCGGEISGRVFALLDGSCKADVRIKDGNAVKKGETILTVSGLTKALLKGERTALNILGHLSGIATQTSLFVNAAREVNPNVIVVDTRKTTPTLRVFEKYAVMTGGGRNHRFNLSDGAMLKDTHIDAFGGIENAARAIKSKCGHMIKIEVEARNLDEVKQAAASGADVIMLDNMSVSDMKAAVDFVDGRAITEASGNITLDGIAEIASTGVDIISSGSMVYNAKRLDVSMKIV